MSNRRKSFSSLDFGRKSIVEKARVIDKKERVSLGGKKIYDSYVLELKVETKTQIWLLSDSYL